MGWFVFVCMPVHVSISLRVYVLSVTSILAAFVLSFFFAYVSVK